MGFKMLNDQQFLARTMKVVGKICEITKLEFFPTRITALIQHDKNGERYVRGSFIGKHDWMFLPVVIAPVKCVCKTVNVGLSTSFISVESLSRTYAGVSGHSIATNDWTIVISQVILREFTKHDERECLKCQYAYIAPATHFAV